ncbi:MAG: ferredoxin--NADP reductase [Bacteroidia bacterium]|nr:ferredoxin--NADP reductase [Bacteroidia bacterium]
MLQTYILPIAKKNQQTKDAVSLHFSQPKVDRIPYYAGQYLTLKVEIEGKIHFRSYSMSSSPQLDDDLIVTIKRVNGGLVSNYIHDNWQEGSLVEFLRPAGSFVTEFATRNRRQLLMIAGGSGITPIYSLLRGILFQEPYSRVSLLYSNQGPNDAIFLEELEDLKRKFDARFDLIHVFTRSVEGYEGSYINGRLDEAAVSNWLVQQSQDTNKEYYLCGPEGLMKTAESALLYSGVSYHQIRKEAFLSNSDMEQRQNRTLQPAREVKVNVSGTVHQFWVPSGATILEAAISQGIELPYSCKRGVCASCMGKLIQGKVDMNDPSALLDFEVEAGKVLTCQAIPVEEGIEIQIGTQ